MGTVQLDPHSVCDRGRHGGGYGFQKEIAFSLTPCLPPMIFRRSRDACQPAKAPWACQPLTPRPMYGIFRSVTWSRWIFAYLWVRPDAYEWRKRMSKNWEKAKGEIENVKESMQCGG